MGKKKPPKKSPAKKKKKKTGSPIRSNLAKSVDPASPSGNLPPATVDDESHCDSATLDPPADGSSLSPSLVSEQKALAPVKVVNTTVPEPKTLTDTASVKVVETTVPEPSNEDNVATVKKLKLIKSDIRTFSRDNYSNLERRVQEAHNKLLSAQQNLLQWPSEATALIERSAMEEWQILSKAEERFLLQRSHINSIKGEDCNSAYFHRLIATRRARTIAT
ncbi:hypothetical protein DY000_02049814 [Brassica cretica]|uniref:No apical meristem-associated C-terminal domain-containing protein n=1 Tax=Brassica cretica TaxID=69181 RepID=A0ABQ7F329_BRACR|nr:hypothetical protein DY000_02049814 [Brassica cretica]